jgi:hypothetical protein
MEKKANAHKIVVLGEGILHLNNHTNIYLTTQ